MRSNAANESRRPSCPVPLYFIFPPDLISHLRRHNMVRPNCLKPGQKKRPANMCSVESIGNFVLAGNAKP